MTVGVRTTVSAVAFGPGGRVLHQVYRDLWEGGVTNIHARAFCGFQPRRGWLVTGQVRGSLICRRCREREALR